jgi:hypothetical protein
MTPSFVVRWEKFPRIGKPGREEGKNQILRDLVQGICKFEVARTEV